MRSYWDIFRYIYFSLSPERGLFLVLSLLSLIYSMSDLWLNGFIGYVAFGFFWISVWMFFRDLFEMQDVDVEKNQYFFDTLFDADCSEGWLRDRGVAESDRLASEVGIDRLNFKASGSSPEDDFTLEWNGRIEGMIAYSRRFNFLLRDGGKDFEVHVSKDENARLLRFLRSRDYVFSAFLKRAWWLSLKRKKSFFNEAKVGVFSPILPAASAVKIAKVDYYSSFLTNELSSSFIKHQGAGKSFVLYDGTVLFPKSLNRNASGQYMLLDFGSYISGNHIGVSTIAITKDKFVVFWEQNGLAQQSEKRLAPTGSGSLDWKDVGDFSSLRSIVVNGLEREFHEESNRKGIKIQEGQIEESLLLGYFRNMMRGGKPEFVAISRLSVNNTMLEPNISEVQEQVTPDRVKVNSLLDLECQVSLYLNKKNISIPLWFNLLALKQAIMENPEKISRFCGFN